MANRKRQLIRSSVDCQITTRICTLTTGIVAWTIGCTPSQCPEIALSRPTLLCSSRVELGDISLEHHLSQMFDDIVRNIVRDWCRSTGCKRTSDRRQLLILLSSLECVRQQPVDRRSSIDRIRCTVWHRRCTRNRFGCRIEASQVVTKTPLTCTMPIIVRRMTWLMFCFPVTTKC